MEEPEFRRREHFCREDTVIDNTKPLRVKNCVLYSKMIALYGGLGPFGERAWGILRELPKITPGHLHTKVILLD